MRVAKHQARLPDSIVLGAARRRWVWLLIALAGVTAITVCSRRERTPVKTDDRSRYHDRSFRVVRVVDGDTLILEAPDDGKNVTRVRLWGVDTPEMARGERPAMYLILSYEPSFAQACKSLAGWKVKALGVAQV